MEARIIQSYTGSYDNAWSAFLLSCLGITTQYLYYDQREDGVSEYYLPEGSNLEFIMTRYRIPRQFPMSATTNTYLMQFIDQMSFTLEKDGDNLKVTAPEEYEVDENFIFVKEIKYPERYSTLPAERYRMAMGFPAYERVFAVNATDPVYIRKDIFDSKFLRTEILSSMGTPKV